MSETPNAPETQKAMALQRSVRRHLNFITTVRGMAEDEGVMIGDLLTPERQRDTVYRCLGLDPQKIKEENQAIVSFLMEAAGKQGEAS